MCFDAVDSEPLTEISPKKNWKKKKKESRKQQRGQMGDIKSQIIVNRTRPKTRKFMQNERRTK